MQKGHVARQSIVVNVPIAEVWNALVNPEMIRRYMFGTTVVSDWQPGSPIVFKGEWQGKTYEDKGRILRIERERLIQYTHFSPLSGLPDIPENYHTVTVELSVTKDGVLVSLSQDNNPTEQAREHSEKNWGIMMSGLKRLFEK